jgi:hypothetical protein
MINEDLKTEVEKKYIKEINTFVKVAKMVYDV